MKAKKVLFINQEIVPYVPESELSHMGRFLPQSIQEKGYEIRTFMPKWGNINERRGQLHEVIRLSRMMLIIDETDHPLIIKVASIPATRIQVYFIDNDDYFTKRLMAEDENGVEYPDNGERAVFFARGVLETVKKLRWAPDIGKAYKARWPSVERAIRTCVISCWERGNRDFLNEMAGYPLRERPTVSEFFSIAWVYLCREEQKDRKQ